MALQVQLHAIHDITARTRHSRRTPVRLHDPCAAQHSAKHRKLHHPVFRTHMSARSSYMMVYSDNYGSAAPGEARIKVLGVGGGGGNALQRMIASGMQGVEFWAVNTDAQALASHPATNKLQIGTTLTRGLGAGGDPALGRQAALESGEALHRAVAGAEMVFVTAGMGGGTGTGAAPVVAQASKDAGILTIGVVTCPFSFEGRRRRQQALQGVLDLRAAVDSVIIIPNDKLREVAGQDTSLTNAFALADEVLRQGVQGITNIITVPGLINVDFADVASILSNSGTAMLGMGAAAGGPGRAEEAALAAVSGPLIQQSVQSATGIIFNITGGADLTLAEVNAVSEVVLDLADPTANVIFGAVVDERYSGELQVTLIATGFDQDYEEELLGSTANSSRRSRRQQQQQAAAAADSSSQGEEEEGQEVPAPRGRVRATPAAQQQQPSKGASRWGAVDRQAAPLPWRTTRSYTGRPLL